MQQTLQLICLSGLYSAGCIMAAMICSEFFKSEEALLWLNIFSLIFAVAILEHHLIVQNLLSTGTMIILYSPDHWILCLFITIAIILLSAAGKDLHEFKYEGSTATRIPEFIPMDPTKFGIILFMGILVALLMDHTVWVGMQITSLLFITVCISISAEKLDNNHT